MSCPGKDIEVVVATVAVVFSSIERPPSLPQARLVELLPRPLSVGTAPDGAMVFSSSRGQVEVQLYPNKLDVRDVSGVLSSAQEKVPVILHGFLDLLKQPAVQSYGINLILEVHRDDVEEWLGKHFLNPALEDTLETIPASRLVGFVVERPPKTWTVRLEVVSSGVLHINFNSSESTTSPLLEPDQLAAEIADQHREFMELLQELSVAPGE